MPTLRTLAIVTAAVGVLAALPLTNAQACDDDRFPCPIVSDTSQPEAAEPPRKKVNRAARQDEKSRTKAERPAAARAHDRTKEEKPVAQEHAAEAVSQQAVDPPAALVPWWRADRSSGPEAAGDESPAAAAANAWLSFPNAETPAPSESNQDATEGVSGTSLADGVQMVDPNEVNEIDLAASPAPAEGAWIGYLVMMVGGALAAASTARFFLV
jgi:hypothetical protein